MVGLDNMDAVIRVIKEAPSNAMASTGLRNGEVYIVLVF